MVRIMCENTNSVSEDKELTIRVKLDCYIDDEEFADIQENDVAVGLTEDFLSDIAEWCNNIVYQDLKEDLQADGRESISDSITDIVFEDKCGELLGENIVEIKAKLMVDGELKEMDISRIEKMLGGKQGIIASELPGDVYQQDSENGVVEVLVDPTFTISVIAE